MDSLRSQRISLPLCAASTLRVIAITLYETDSKTYFRKESSLFCWMFPADDLCFVFRLEATMEKIPVVETAKASMTEAVTWSVMKWLREKKTVRKIADQANTALDQLNRQVKDRWPADVKAAYESLAKPSAGNMQARGRNELASLNTDSQVLLSAKKVKEADDEAYCARMDAEQTFDIAEKQLSTALAREGCRKAIRSWELHEKAIRKAEALIPSQSIPARP